MKRLKNIIEIRYFELYLMSSNVLLYRVSFFILGYRNILRNTHRTEKMSAMKSFHFRGRKPTPKKLTPHPRGGGGGIRNFKWEPLFLIGISINVLVFISQLQFLNF